MFRGFSLPGQITLRGAGLGNEVIPWGKAFIGGMELGLRVLHPSWAMNRRNYRADFQTTRFDWAGARALSVLGTVDIAPEEVFGHTEYRSVVLSDDVTRRIAGARAPVVVRHTSGMVGGFLSIYGARDYLRHELLAPAQVVPDLYRATSSLSGRRLTVALHIRRGDFALQQNGPTPGTFNQAIPVRWYRDVCGGLIESIGVDNLQFIVFSDGNGDPEIAKLVKEIRAVNLPVRRRPLLSDLSMMANADLLLCSVSSLSMLAAFLSDRPYVWFSRHLSVVDGWCGIWASELGRPSPQFLDSRTRNVTSSDLFGRGFALDYDDGPGEALVNLLRDRLRTKDQNADLLYYGALPS